MKSPIIICFQGNDGSGKSTQAKKLEEYLKTDNLNVSYLWNKFEPCLSRPITKIVSILFFKKKGIYENYSEHVKQKRNLVKNRFISKAYKSIWLSDYILQIEFRLAKSYLKSDILILDRYYYDAVVDVATDLSFSEKETTNLVKKISKIFPNPDLIFLLDVPADVSCKRKEDIPSIDYIKERRGIYLKIGKFVGMNIIDGTKNENEIHSFIRRCLNDKYDNFRY